MAGTFYHLLPRTRVADQFTGIKALRWLLLLLFDNMCPAVRPHVAAKDFIAQFFFFILPTSEIFYWKQFSIRWDHTSVRG